MTMPDLLGVVGRVVREVTSRFGRDDEPQETAAKPAAEKAPVKKAPAKKAPAKKAPAKKAMAKPVKKGAVKQPSTKMEATGTVPAKRPVKKVKSPAPAKKTAQRRQPPAR
jgi:hypothetical protein